MIGRLADRQGHELRCAVDCVRVRRLNRAPQRSFEERRAAAVDWYRRRPDWWRPLLGPERTAAG